ncbi:hypothetical protein AVEN_129271-1 [Araneus ventricosus]|uniref:Uncharacterized protein n=1 Tax=Araneus ventricosus TaxID=182803 RepID=A0A4Y2HM83_ARAVE|nr:hypothetical protein AVEN_129271-1 [Araneus ventricosus]
MHKVPSKNSYNFCDHASKDNELDILCTRCFKTEHDIECKINSKINLEIQAKNKTKMNSEKKFPTSSLGTPVRVPIPDVHKVRDDSQNILAVARSVKKNGFYRLGTSD